MIFALSWFSEPPPADTPIFSWLRKRRRDITPIFSMRYAEAILPRHADYFQAGLCRYFRR
jgi:hypothetical protein